MASDAIAGDLRDRLSQRQPSIRLLTDQRADRIDDFISTAIGDSNSQNHPGIGCCGLGGGTDRVAQRAGQEVEFSDRPHPNATVVDVRVIGERGDLRFYRSKDTRGRSRLSVENTHSVTAGTASSPHQSSTSSSLPAPKE